MRLFTLHGFPIRRGMHCKLRIDTKRGDLRGEGRYQETSHA